MTMNRIIYTLFILFTGITTISAQDYDKWVKEQWDKEFNGPSNRPLYRHEIGVTIGGAVAFNNKRYLSFTDNAKSKYNLFNNGWIEHAGSALSIRYFYHHKRYLALGASVGYASCHDGYYRDDWDIHDTDLNARSYYLIPTVKGQWVDNKGFGLYSKFGFGIGVQHMWMVSDFYEDEGIEKWCVHPAYQITFLGIDFGIRKFRINLELGVGWEGIFSMGTTYYFGRERGKK